jgi:hypothetical protein
MKKVVFNSLLIYELPVRSSQRAGRSETNQMALSRVKNPDTCNKNKNGEEVIMNEAGWDGIFPERMDFEFTKINQEKLTRTNSITITEKTVE